MNDSILNLINERGILLQKELFELLSCFQDVKQACLFLDILERASGQKMITASSLTKHVEYINKTVQSLNGETKQLVETTLIKMGLTVEVQKMTEVNSAPEAKQMPYRVFYADTRNRKKIDVGDFVNHFRARYQQLQQIIMQRPDVQNLVSINKISRDRQRFSIIGIVTDKRTTAHKNLIITFEDLTGRAKALVRAESECFSKAAELQLDDVVAVKVSGGSDFLFIHDVIYPDAFKEKTRFDQEMCIAFVSDIHAGSLKHLGSEFQHFVEWLRAGDELAAKIKYIFFVGDNVDGVGVFPGQERLLKLTSLKEQYDLLAGYLRGIPPSISMFMCPGQHDSVRVAEPQPIIDNFYGAALHEIPNLILVSNPAMVKLLEGDKEFKILMYHGASIHSFINEIGELRLMKAHNCPAKAVRHMLKRRHLAPSHGISPSIVYIPNANHDPLVISEVPDVLCTGEVHRLDVETYNGSLIITGSCWQSQTEFEEKVGNVPDPCKVPILNLKTRELKVLDFST